MAVRYTAATQARMLAKAGAEREHIDMINRYVSDSRRFTESAVMQQKWDSKARANEAARAVSDLMLEETEKKAEMERKAIERKAYQDRMIAGELAKRKVEEEAMAREIQRICEEDPGLRELQQKIQTAYLNKERSLQDAERARIREEEERKAAAEHQKLIAKLTEEEKMAAEEERKKQLDLIRTRIIIERQQEQKEREEAARVALQQEKDKAMVDAIVKKIEAEDQAEANKRMRKIEESREIISKYLKEREELRIRQKQEELEWDRKIASHEALTHAREADHQMKLRELEREKEKIYQRLCEEQQRREAELQADEDARLLLYEEEIAKREYEKEQARLRRIQEEKDVLNKARLDARHNRYMADLQKRQEEERIKEAMQRKFAEDERIEAEEMEKRRLAKEEYKHGIAAQREERDRIYREQQEQFQREMEIEKEEAEFKKRVVEEARKKLLREHAAKLKDFLPRGVLQSKEDLEWISQFDTNGDGVLDDHEVKRAESAFMKHDLNGDGVLDEEEKTHAVNHFKSNIPWG